MIVGDNLFIENKILASSAILEAAPRLRELKSVVVRLQRECSTCSGKKEARRQLNEVWNEIRTELVNLPEEVKLFIRERAGGGRPIRIAYQVGSGSNRVIKSGEL